MYDANTVIRTFGDRIDALTTTQYLLPNNLASVDIEQVYNIVLGTCNRIFIVQNNLPGITKRKTLYVNNIISGRIVFI